MLRGLAVNRPSDRRRDGSRRIFANRASDWNPIEGFWRLLGLLILIILGFVAVLLAIGYLEMWLFGW